MSDDDLEYDAPRDGPQILWGRVLVLLLALALAFWLGTTFGGDTGARTRLADQRDRVAELEAEVASLEAQIAALDAGADQVAAAPPSEAADGASEPAIAAGQADAADDPDAVDDPDAADEPDAADAAPSEAESDAASGAGSEYVVQSGDSLAAIAQEVYGDPTLWREIAEANDLQPPYALIVGDALRIPEQP